MKIQKTQQHSLWPEIQQILEFWPDFSSPVSSIKKTKGNKKAGRLIVVANPKDWDLVKTKLASQVGFQWVQKDLLAETHSPTSQGKSKKSMSFYLTEDGPVWVVRTYLHAFGKIKNSEAHPQEMASNSQVGEVEGHLGYLSSSTYLEARESVGEAFGLVTAAALNHLLHVDFYGEDLDFILGSLVGMGMAHYQFNKVRRLEKSPLQILWTLNDQTFPEEIYSQGKNIAIAVNLARHLTNLPPNLLHPRSYAELLEKIFSSGSFPQNSFKFSLWNEDQLIAENCHLILAVGQGANHKPCLVHLSYRPSCLQNSLGVEESKVKAREQKNFKKASPTPDNKLQYKTQDKPQYKKVAFVGKGITFDSGGLDLKPSSGMRWMKKDMGGSAALVGLAWWVAQTQPEFCCDFYLPLAENAVSQNSFRPGDVYDSKVGLKVEIHNTDAEGRLVLADAMTVALQDKPDLLIDVATLTGAIKAGLGSGIAGLFGNRDLWIAQMLESSQKRGDWMWPMPLFQSYQTALKSQFADLVNASEGFGGAITAALFLQQFVQNCPWLHLDIYAWKDGVEGPLLESGANGQPVQALIHFLNHFNSCSPIK